METRSNRYHVTAVRKSKGLYTDEGNYADEAAALVRLAELGDDPDFLIAEVTERLDVSPHSLDREIVVAQSAENGSALKANYEYARGLARPKLY